MIRRLIRRIPPDTVRYLVAGVATTAVNFVVFAALTKLLAVNDRTANLVAIPTAIAFAYVVNKLYVFRSREHGTAKTAAELVKFLGGRLFTMAVEYYGYIVIAAVLGNELVAKAVTQAAVFILNYVVSKWIVFRKHEA